MATIEKHGKTWRYRISYKDPEGNYQRISKPGFKTKSEAKIAAAEIEVSISKGANPILHDVTLSDYYRKWVEIYKEPNVGNVSMSRFNNIATVIDNYFPEKKIKDISKMDYQVFMNEYQSSRSTVTCKKTNSIIRSCIHDAIDDQIIYSDFTRKVTINGKSSRKKSKKYLSIKNFTKLIDYTNKNKSLNGITYYMVLTGAYTGLRFEEIGGLTWDSINFKNNKITIDKVYDYTYEKKIVPRTKTESSKRTIPMLPELAIILKQLKKVQVEWQLKSQYRDPENAVFRSTDLKIPSDAGCIKTLKYIQKQIGIDETETIRTHGLRHTLASYLLSQGVQIKYVSELLGHANTSITMKTYEHLLKEQNKEQENKAALALTKLKKIPAND